MPVHLGIQASDTIPITTTIRYNYILYFMHLEYCYGLVFRILVEEMET